MKHHLICFDKRNAKLVHFRQFFEPKLLPAEVKLHVTIVLEDKVVSILLPAHD